MAGDHTGDQSFYDFLIEEPEMIAPAPPGHFPPQQPISSPNRTSRDAPPRTEPTEIETHHHANHQATLPVLGMQLPGTLPDSSRAQSRAHLDLNLDLHAHPHSHSHSHSHGSHLSHGAHGIQSHGHGHATHPAHSSAGLPSAGFASHLPSASTSPMTLDWNIYNVPPNLQLNPSHFDFEVPGHMGVVGHSSHLAHASTDPTTYAYGSNLVSPSSIHPDNAHFDTNASTQWEDSLGHDSSTPKVRTPAHQMASNPWAEIEETLGDNKSSAASRPRKTPRSRRQKKEARKLSDDSQGARSSSTGGTAPSVSDAASPSTTSQNSRTSVGSKSVSMASTVSVSTASAVSSRQSKLRSASRTSKNSRDKPNDTPEDRRTRASHNLVEKQYRNRLNAQFESLLSALPEQVRHGNGGSENGSGNGNGDNESDQANDPDRRVSKGEVLEMARKHIEALERERSQLEMENLELHGSIRRLKGSNSESTESSLGPGSSTEHDTNNNQKRADDGNDRNEKS